MKKVSQTGFGHLGLLLLLLVAAVVAFAGYKVYNNNPADTAINSSVSQSAQSIKSKADLSKVENQLNSQNIDGDLNPSSFDSDISSLN
jgi:uncharacterized protein YpuA (DUF1002 family)